MIKVVWDDGERWWKFDECVTLTTIREGHTLWSDPRGIPVPGIG